MTYRAKFWKCFLIAAMLVLILPSARAQTESVTECTSSASECFRLYTACQPIGLSVENLNSDANDIGLQKQAVVNAAESRLRSARIYDPSAQDYLYVNINVVANAFSIWLGFNKMVFDLRSFSALPAATWSSGVTGTHGKDSQYILGNLSRHLDSFLVGFLRVNEPACGDTK